MAIRPRNRPSAEFSLATISDIVFLLLIFFMVTSTFVNQSAVRVDFPTSNSSTPSDGAHTVTITADGRYLYNSTELPTREALVALLSSELDKPGADKSVTLQVDKAVTHEESTPVIAVVAEHGGKVNIATKRR